MSRDQQKCVLQNLSPEKGSIEITGKTSEKMTIVKWIPKQSLSGDTKERKNEKKDKMKEKTKTKKGRKEESKKS